ncbi:MAG: Fic family protein [Egibacteraceae bacterium]
MPPSAELPGGARFQYSDHLVRLVAEAHAAAAVLARGPASVLSQAGEHARRRAALWSARLDGSPIEDETARGVDERSPSDPVSPLVGGAASGEGGWARALKLDGLASQDVAAVEYANLLTAWEAEPALAADVLERPSGVLVELHGLICQDLVAPEVVGRPRRTVQAVHDGSQGKMLYAPPAPERLPALLAQLLDWVGVASATRPDLILAGVVHERLLEWQPFEAGNGRTARAFTRVLLRARGLDPHGLALPEHTWITDPLAYYGEVAATIRRRGDLTRWLERYAEAVVEGLDRVAGQAGPWAGSPLLAEDAVRAVVSELGADKSFTLTEVASRAGVGRDVALTVLRSGPARTLVWSEPGSQGLRYRRRDD